MSDSRLRGDVIPLFPGADAGPAPRLSLPTGLQGPAEEVVRLLAPAVLIAAGVFLVTLMAGGIGNTFGWLRTPPFRLARELGTWVLLGASGTAIMTRGLALARVRWR